MSLQPDAQLALHQVNRGGGRAVPVAPEECRAVGGPWVRLV
ncbi:hypothetical protein [Streptomyces sp. NBC_01320]|nr:hypothetical protein OG395_52570 [Streptomyces sp. NBC_01320]